MTRWFVHENGHAVARVEAGGAYRITARTGKWESFPDLGKLAFRDPDFSWDEVDEATGRAKADAMARTAKA
jgi:hypothetical protein